MMRSDRARKSLRLSGDLTLNLRALRLGNKGPRTVIVAGIHGDEVTGLLLLARLLGGGWVPRTCHVDMVAPVNLLGVMLNQRRLPMGRADLNSLLKPDGSSDVFGVGLMKQLAGFCGGANLVLDLHSWDTPSALFGIYHSQAVAQGSRGLEALARIGCQFVWMVGDEEFVSGSLGAHLSRVEVPYAGVELPAAHYLNSLEVDALARRLMAAIDEVGDVKVPPLGKRIVVVTRTAGLFDAVVQPRSRVRSGSPIGDIYSARSLRRIATICSPCDGIMLHTAIPGYVYPGENVACIGSPTT